MKRFLLDTGAMGDFMNHRRGVADKVRERAAAAIALALAFRLLQSCSIGVEFSATRDENIRRLRRALAGVINWPFDQAAAEEYGRIAANLRRIGRPMQVVDMMVAAIAASLGQCTVVSSDSDLSAVPGLSVENWAK